MATYKQKCYKCKKNYVIVGYRNRFPVCYECQKEGLAKPIKDAKMKKFFDIPEKLYKDSSFLRSIKLNYLEYENLSERQIEAFKETVKKLKVKMKEPKEEPTPDPTAY